MFIFSTQFRHHLLWQSLQIPLAGLSTLLGAHLVSYKYLSHTLHTLPIIVNMPVFPTVHGRGGGGGHLRGRHCLIYFIISSSVSEKAMAPHSCTLAWRIPGTGAPGGLPSMGSHRVGHDRRDLAAAAAAQFQYIVDSNEC